MRCFMLKAVYRDILMYCFVNMLAETVRYIVLVVTLFTEVF